MVITNFQIIQIDATILAGILILLTLVFIGGESSLIEKLEADKTERGLWDQFTKTPVAWIYGIGVFFSLSAVFAIAAIPKESDEESSYHTTTHFIAIGFMGFGFFTFVVAFWQLGIILIN